MVLLCIIQENWEVNVDLGLNGFHICEVVCWIFLKFLFLFVAIYNCVSATSKCFENSHAKLTFQVFAVGTCESTAKPGIGF